jgi:hypothetical protein
MVWRLMVLVSPLLSTTLSHGHLTLRGRVATSSRLLLFKLLLLMLLLPLVMVVILLLLLLG